MMVKTHPMPDLISRAAILPPESYAYAVCFKTSDEYSFFYPCDTGTKAYEIGGQEKFITLISFPIVLQ